MSRWFSRRWGAFLGGVAGAITIIFAVLLLITQTEKGRARVLEITMETLGGQLNGTLVVERLEGGLFTGARMYQIVLRDPAGHTMVAADSAYIDYRLPTFFGGDVVIQRLVLYDADIALYRMPGDSLWNYQAVLQDTTPEVPGRRGRATIIEQMRLVNAAVTIRLPWEPNSRLSDAERRREIAEALSDSSRLDVERVPGGYLRTIVARTPDSEIEALTVAPDERGGTYLRLVRGSAVVGLYSDIPLRLEGMQGELSLREGLMRYVAPTIILPDSRLSSAGVVDLRGDEPAYDLRIAGDEIALRDVQWLYPAFPDEGRASVRLDVETHGYALLLRAADLTFEAPGTRLTGQFGIVMGDSLLFSNVSLRADPLDVNTVEQMLPTQIPVRGLRIGSVEIHSPAS